MKLAFYSSNATFFDGNIMHYYNYPSNTDFWTEFLAEHPDIELYFITQMPGMFLLDLQNEELLESKYRLKLNYYILNKSSTSEDFVSTISEIKPDKVIAASFWLPPLDYLPVQDSIIGEQLKQKGFNVVCHPVETSLICFDKYRTHNFLSAHNFNIAKAVFVDHELFWAERNRKEINHNVYKESVFYQINQMKLPLIIKDTGGLSSFGMEVCTTYGQVKNFLTSKKNQSDRLVEELIPGDQFGLELYADGDDIFISDPFMFSVNQYGITSPKQSVKVGPVNNPKYKIDELKTEIMRLIKELDLCGFAQVDLVFDGQKWYIIEINPRLSGMTEIVKASRKIPDKTLVAIKFQLLEDFQIEDFKQLPYVYHISQVKNDAALQRREQGYCEVILDAEYLSALKQKFPSLMEENFYESAVMLLGKIN